MSVVVVGLGVCMWRTIFLVVCRSCCVARFGAAGYNFRPRIDRVALLSELNGAFCFILL